MSKDTRAFFGVITIIAIVSAWVGIGCIALEKRIPEWPRAQTLVRRAGFACVMIACLTLFNGVGGFLTLVLLTGTPPDRIEAHVFGIPVPTPRWLERAIIGFFAVVIDALALATWVLLGTAVVKWAFRKQPPAPP